MSGNQRISILDDLEQRQDYVIGVSVVKMPLVREKELNVFLNNKTAQGFYDQESLMNLLQDPDISMNLTGFTMADLEMQFGTLPGITTVVEEESKPVQETAVAEIKEAKKEHKEKTDAAHSEQAAYYLLVYFNSDADKQRFCRHMSLEETARVVAVEEIMHAFKPESLWRKADFDADEPLKRIRRAVAAEAQQQAEPQPEEPGA